MSKTLDSLVKRLKKPAKTVGRSRFRIGQVVAARWSLLRLNIPLSAGDPLIVKEFSPEMNKYRVEWYSKDFPDGKQGWVHSDDIVSP
jgi:hypothetical protein